MGQVRLLARTFFARMFESDLMPDGLPQVQLILWGALLVATPTSGYPVLLAKKYAYAQAYGPLAAEFDADRAILITLSMMAIGVVGLFVWDGVFPDRRDVRILGALPVATRHFVAARLAALAKVYVLFAVPVCLLQSVVFGLLVAGYGDPLPRLYGIAAHFVTVALACTFVFCALIASQCLLLVLFGRRGAQAASMTFQVLFAIALIQLIAFMGEIGRVLREGSASWTAVAALPPTWFFGLYEILAGRADASAFAAGRFAVAVTAASLVLAPALYAASYATLSRRALEGAPPQTAHAARAAAARLLIASHRLGYRSPLRAAVRQFAVRTLVRSRTHRMMLALYGGVALAMVISSAVSVTMHDNGSGLWRPVLATLSMPLIFQFLLLAGIRVIIAVPSEPKARWIFRACEPVDRSAAVSGARDMMMLLVVLPTSAFALLQGLIFWSVWAAISHAAFCLAVGSVFAELLVARTGKLPFACTYYPGTSGVFSLWPLYLLLFFFYTLALAELDRTLISHPVRLMLFCACLFGAGQLLAAIRGRGLRALPALRFDEEDPHAIFEGFHLSEGLAAAPKPTKLFP